MTELISSHSNATIKLARALRQKRTREEKGLFLLEGILHVGEAAEAGWKFENLIYSPEILTSDFGLKLVSELEKKGVRCLRVTESAFESFAEKENPQGIAAIVREKSRTLEEISSANLLVAIVSPQDPGNVGTILRTIDAAGAGGLILLDGGVKPYHPSAVRASMGTLFWVPFCETSFKEFIFWARSNKKRIIGTSAHATTDFNKVKLDNRPTILLLGSEQKGLLPNQIMECDELISLPMRGHATSLNLAVAAGIFLYGLKG